SRGRSKEKLKSKARGRSKLNMARSKSKSRGITCWNCGKRRHAKKDCWFKGNKENQLEGIKEENPTRNIVQDDLIISFDTRVESW
ncbi:hypothetical protein KI387_019438, partial [Taxus chinensis]